MPGDSSRYSPDTHYIFLRVFFIKFLILRQVLRCTQMIVRCGMGYAERRLHVARRNGRKVVFLVGGVTELSKIKLRDCRGTMWQACMKHVIYAARSTRTLSQRAIPIDAIFIERSHCTFERKKTFRCKRRYCQASIKRSGLMHRAVHCSRPDIK